MHSDQLTCERTAAADEAVDKVRVLYHFFCALFGQYWIVAEYVWIGFPFSWFKMQLVPVIF